MSKNKKIIPELRFPEFANEAEWEKKTLNSVSEVIMGSSPSSTSYNENKFGLPLLQGNADIKNRVSAPRIYTSEITKECEINDILLSVRAPVGTVAKSLHNACIGRGISAIRTIDQNSQEYLYQWLLSYESSWENISQGGTFDAVNSDDIKKLLLPIPKPPEQQKIASCLSSLDDTIFAYIQKLELLKDQKKGLMQNLFPQEGENVPKYRFPEFVKKGDWVEKILDEVAIFLKGKGISKADIVENGSLPCIRYGELYTYYKETISTVKSYTNLSADDLVLSEANDVIIPASGETQIDIATASCVLQKGIALGGDLNIIRSKIDGVFLSYYLNNVKKKDIAQMAQGIAVVHLYPNQLRTLIIQIPKPKEQRKIANCLSSLDALITAQTDKIETLKLHKRGLMQRLFPKIND
ncbi:type I restriction enzyme, S subunit [Mucilaginibacter pineti]|uniref:Type I restriction enzyme, S subunit n=1 Tax=Mucilaginibacter pineti TaxID=1391627 RepID=A0A1G7GCD8_9SPHI|nr:restriction endonuclease subunit S [Mucilaginibacter pineti]SDE85755.1 type I restriction enzyme, S subunit [Mucilaginibacter pineti]